MSELPEAPAPAPDHRRRTIIIGCVAAIVAAVVAVVVVLVVVTGSSSNTPKSPTQAAQEWIDAHVHHDLARERSLTCDSSGLTAEMFDVTVGGLVESVHAEPAQPQPNGTWAVSLDVKGPGGRDEGSFPVTVEKRNGKYLVCSR